LLIRFVYTDCLYNLLFEGYACLFMVEVQEHCENNASKVFLAEAFEEHRTSALHGKTIKCPTSQTAKNPKTT
jgi:hypothetical protein